MAPNPPTAERLRLGGTVTPLVKARDGQGGHTPTRPLGGWLIVWGLLKADGGVLPVVDRDRQVFEAAANQGQIDVSEYLTKGVWNDTHRKPEIVVGVPTTLEYHGPDSELAKAHGKVGWWTEGHLLDRGDAASWELYLPRGAWPDSQALDRADHFWRLSQLLKGTPRPLGLSAEGAMALTPDRRRIVWARVEKAAVCEVPVNPATTVEPMALGMSSEAAALRALAPEDLEGGNPSVKNNVLPSISTSKQDVRKRRKRLAALIQQRYGVDAGTASRWIANFLQSGE